MAAPAGNLCSKRRSGRETRRRRTEIRAQRSRTAEDSLRAGFSYRAANEHRQLKEAAGAFNARLSAASCTDSSRPEPLRPPPLEQRHHCRLPQAQSSPHSLVTSSKRVRQVADRPTSERRRNALGPPGTRIDAIRTLWLPHRESEGPNARAPPRPSSHPGPEAYPRRARRRELGATER